MNYRQAALALLALAATLPLAMAQGPSPAGGSDRSVVATPAGPAESPIQSPRSVHPDADARLCLEFPTSLQVIMCAEKYRPRKRKA